MKRRAPPTDCRVAERITEIKWTGLMGLNMAAELFHTCSGALDFAVTSTFPNCSMLTLSVDLGQNFASVDALGRRTNPAQKKKDGIVPGNSSSANFLFRLVSKPSQVCSEECLFAFKPAGVPTEC